MTGRARRSPPRPIRSVSLVCAQTRRRGLTSNPQRLSRLPRRLTFDLGTKEPHDLVMLPMGIAPTEVDELPRKATVEKQIREEVGLVCGISSSHASESVFDEAVMAGSKLARPDVLGAHSPDVLRCLDLKQRDGVDGRVSLLGQLLIEPSNEGRSEAPLS